MKTSLTSAFVLLTAFLAGQASAQDDGLPPLPPRQHGENHNPKAAKWAELPSKNMPDEKDFLRRVGCFSDGQLAVDYKAKTKDQGAAKDAGAAAIRTLCGEFRAPARFADGV